MIDFFRNIYDKVVEHFATMTTIVLFFTVIKLLIPIVAYIANRIGEHNAYKSFSAIEHLSDDEARAMARSIWRPKSKPPKWWGKLHKKIFKRKK
ncbi:hypothetical protein CEQ31_005030 [Serratia odorifera]|uniref:Uncharacterized protein n=1 Tax=Serratia odorifera DSM 4582 TaxID=667129 RepID=D4E7G0_SEROD|nr:hypothetical protein HMPREF0758_4110 [Serratia odorifera DSM 4582]PNK89111.1 hypothetical protein CEQ31_005030 [Serratia odorifera]RII69859.1 hypothetical protein DX901_21265 [Serratia odorifera]